MGFFIVLKSPALVDVFAWLCIAAFLLLSVRAIRSLESGRRVS